MSYDFHLLRIAPGEDADEVFGRMIEAAEGQGNTRPLDPEKEARKRRIADALIAADPQLEPFRLRHDQIATHLGISEEEARLRYRHIELNGPENGPGIQITLEDDSATVTIPYWHEGGAAASAFERLWADLRVLSADGNFQVYDPQLGRVLDLDADRRAVLDRYTKVVGLTRTPLDGAVVRKRPWWKFWGEEALAHSAVLEARAARSTVRHPWLVVVGLFMVVIYGGGALITNDYLGWSRPNPYFVWSSPITYLGGGLAFVAIGWWPERLGVRALFGAVGLAALLYGLASITGGWLGTPPWHFKSVDRVLWLAQHPEALSLAALADPRPTIVVRDSSFFPCLLSGELTAWGAALLAVAVWPRYHWERAS